ncbi:hypothetical protein GBA52_028508 [Prunus armeniaca]|nr:hypothetical protein GBA52_028508 [Prunus armeniaca]
MTMTVTTIQAMVVANSKMAIVIYRMILLRRSIWITFFLRGLGDGRFSLGFTWLMILETTKKMIVMTAML